MSSLVRLLAIVLLTVPAVPSAQAAFSSIHVFGDGVSTTTNNPYAGAAYHGLRRSNGRVWVEVLAERQALPNNSVTNVTWTYSTNNYSFFAHYSSLLVQSINGFNAPTDAGTALFVIWVANADFVFNVGNRELGNQAEWTSANHQTIANHWYALTNLYHAKGARTFVMPNAVDITKIPSYVDMSTENKNFVRQNIIEFNAAFYAMLDQARILLPAARIYVPDMFALLDDIAAHPANYGVTNALFEGKTVDALSDETLTDKSLNGPGASYIWWDDTDPTAKVHAVMADITQQLLSPPIVSQLTHLGSSNRLDVANIPIGLNGYVDSRTDLVVGNWFSVTNFNSTAATQTLFTPASGSGHFYRLRFPFAWSWP
ncbi:MAG TPA: SGNH/GDSL hydrolase family protein [Candidatus Paceibacterota bacterium]|nr:SGNH/GDSL hydrolase family protein [Verrucomicrobiota bacterium]HSA10413.1 SGNH/GDSL hydrolase family protein [Candidatus Paceibacterota bacterium]